MPAFAGCSRLDAGGWWGVTKKSKVDGHSQADDGEQGGKESDAAGLILGDFAVTKLAHKLNVTEGGEGVDEDTQKNERGSEPKGKLMGGCGGGVRYELKFLEEEAEPRDDEPETHEGEAGANPCEEGALGSAVVAEGGFGERVDGPGPSTAPHR